MSSKVHHNGYFADFRDLPVFVVFVLEGYLMKSLQTKTQTLQKSSENTISGVICCEINIHHPPIQVYVKFSSLIRILESVRVQGVPSKVQNFWI